MRNRLSLFLILLVLISTLVLFGWKLLKPSNVEALPPEKNVPVQVDGLGTLEVHTLSKIGFMISGVLVKLNADQGDRAKTGDIPAQLETAEQESRAGKAPANVEHAKVAILVARAGRDRARVTLSHRENLLQRRLERQKAALGQQLLDGRYPVETGAFQPAQQVVKASPGAKAGDKAILIGGQRR